jgi:hypothetical protein
MRLVRGIVAVATCGLIGSASAHELMFRALLSGSGSEPISASAGVGTALIVMDLDLANMEVQTQFDGLTSNATGALLHGITPSSNTGIALPALPLPAFPTGVESGMHSELVDLTLANSYSPDFINRSGGAIVDALNATYNGLLNSRMYMSIKTADHANGEIGGFFQIFPDANDDGVIDSADFTPIAEHYNTFGNDFHSGDYNLDAYTNALDFNIIASMYGESVDFAEASPLGSLIPEPSGMGAMLLLAGALNRRRSAR